MTRISLVHILYFGSRLHCSQVCETHVVLDHGPRSWLRGVRSDQDPQGHREPIAPAGFRPSLGGQSNKGSDPGARVHLGCKFVGKARREWNRAPLASKTLRDSGVGSSIHFTDNGKRQSKHNYPALRPPHFVSYQRTVHVPLHAPPLRPLLVQSMVPVALSTFLPCAGNP